MKITDEYVLSREKLNTQEAAAYLGMSWWTLVDGLRRGKLPFGTARLGNGGKWIYNIPARRVYRYKHGLDMSVPADEVRKAVDNLTGMLNTLCEQLTSKEDSA